MIELFVDGASAGHPGPSGIGIFLRGEGHIWHIAQPIEPTNNHIAEFIALQRGLEYAKEVGTTFVRAHSDSRTVVDAVNRKRTKNETFQPYVEAITALIASFDLCFVEWIAERHNRAADQLAKRAIHLTEPHIRKQ